MMAVITLLLYFFAFSWPTSSHHVDIVNNSSHCVGTSSVLECATLDQRFSSVPSCILENTILNFQHGLHSTGGLSGLIEIQSIADINIQGHESIVECHGNVGFMFRRVDRLQIQGLSFHNCGAIFKPSLVRSLIPSQKFDDTQTFWSTNVSIVIADSYDISLRQVKISGSTGYGLLAVNLLGDSILHEIFLSHSNHAAIRRYELNFDLCQYPENIDCSGGNVVLLYEMCSVCSPGPHRLEISHMVAEYGVSLERWDVGLGIEVAGGLTISLQQSMQYFATIVIQDSIIASNIGKYAGNSVVHLYSTSCRVTFRNTSILNGNADLSYYADLSFSGGMYAVSGQILEDKPFSKYLHIENSTFANNSGLYGGALCVTSLIDDDFDNIATSVLLISGCDFRENRGYGSIVRFSVERTGERPKHESINYLSVTLNNT